MTADKPSNRPGDPSDAESTLRDDALASAGHSIGPYLLRELIGTGGMGEVWRAEQTEPVRRTVALKLIKSGMDSREVLARFEAERQALALMDHPNIAKVLDAGTTPQGRPYFAMEYVQGVPITEHCDTHRLTTRERLGLFTQVCEGVQHAHQKAIIHRDIKPSNALVAIQDGNAIPKIIDFGVAKALAQPLTERTLFTEMGQLIGTPAYMSPEQAEMTGQNIDTRTDVYSLGALLYELLAGAAPFDSKELREAGLEGIRKAIREVEPPRPSTRVSGLGVDSTTSATNRGTVPKALSGELRGDLDWITMRALDKDRTRRYSSPLDLAEDLRRYLRREPVHAHPPSTAYRLQKLVTRNKLPAAFAATVTVLLVGLAVTMSVLRTQAETARAAAQARAEELELVTEFQSSMLSEIDAEAMGTALVEDFSERVRESLGEEGLSANEVETALATFEETLLRVNATDAALTMIDEHVLKRAVDTIETAFADQPVVQAALQHTVATTYGAIGRDASAVPLQEAALRTRRQLLGEDHPATLASISGMCEILRRMGKFDEALVFCREALEGCGRALGDDHPGTLGATNNLGYLLSSMGKDDEALPLYKEALEGSHRALGDDHPETLRSINNVGALLVEMGELDDAVVYYREALEGNRRVLGPDHPHTLASISNMGGLFYRMGKPDEALGYLHEALEVRRRSLGHDHPETLASIQNMGILLSSMGKFEEAIVYQREAAEEFRRVLGEEHPKTLQTAAGVASTLRSMGKLDEALDHYRETAEVTRRVLGDDHPLTLQSIAGIGYVLTSMGKLDEALVHCREALDGRRRVLGDDNPKTLSLIGNMGRLLKEMDKNDEALGYHQEALEGFRRVLGDDHPGTLTSIYNLASLLLDLNKPEQTLALVEPAEAPARRAFTGRRADRLGTLLATLGRARVATGALEAARTNLNEAQQILADAPNAGEKDVEWVHAGLVELYESWHATEPNDGHDLKAAEWRTRLDELQAEIDGQD